MVRGPRGAPTRARRAAPTPTAGFAGGALSNGRFRLSLEFFLIKVLYGKVKVYAAAGPAGAPVGVAACLFDTVAPPPGSRNPQLLLRSVHIGEGKQLCGDGATAWLAPPLVV